MAFQSVRRLPIFVVASSKFYVLLGPSYATRCWCMLELFVFKACQSCGLFTDSELIIAPLRTMGGANTHLADLANKFNIHDTMCFRDVDRQTIFGIVETAGDGHLGFTEAVRSLAKAAGKELGDEVPPAEEMPSGSKSSPSRRSSTSPQALRKRANAKGGVTPPPSPGAPGDEEAAGDEQMMDDEQTIDDDVEVVEVIVA